MKGVGGGIRVITIYTLGDFDMKKQGETILNWVGYSYRLDRLFKYFLTFKDKKRTPERIIEDLWYEEEFADPKKVLRTQISRLRRVMDGKGNIEVFFEIIFSRGYYVFHLDEQKAKLDVDIFEKTIKRGNYLEDNNKEDAIKAYKEAILMYKGKYLDQNDYGEWLIPTRNRYERLYVQSLLRLLELLKGQRDYIEIVEICEDAMDIIPLNESVNIYFMDALINIGDWEYALNHYEYFTSKLYREMNRTPSEETKRFYRKLKYDRSKGENIRLSHIDDKLGNEIETDGALLCDLDYFIPLYNLEKRRNLRAREKRSFVGIITINVSNKETLSKDGYSKHMEHLKKIMHSLLRKGDVFTIWNENQIVFILYNIEQKDISGIRDRLISNFNLINKDLTIYLDVDIELI